MPEHHLPEQANAGLPLQPVWQPVWHESRNARSFAQRLYHFLNASALTAVSSRTLTIAILALATWLATPTTVQAQQCSYLSPSIRPGSHCIYTGTSRQTRFFFNHGSNDNVVCISLGTTPSANGCVVPPGNPAQIELDGLEAEDYAIGSTWTLTNIPGIPNFAEMVPDQPYNENQPITALTLPPSTRGLKPLTYSLTGLPAGLNFNKGTRRLSGTPTQSGPFTASYSAESNNGKHNRDNPLTFTITVKSIPTFGTASVPDQEYTATQFINLALPDASGGSGALRYSLTGFPTNSGLRFIEADPDTIGATNSIFGTTNSNDLNSNGSRRTYQLTYKATDEDGTETPNPLTITIVVNPAPSFGSAGFDNKVYPLDQQIEDLTLRGATGGAGTLTYDLRIDGRTPPLPENLTFNKDTLTLSGTPVQAGAGSHTIVYTARDQNGVTTPPDSGTFTITVGEAPRFAEGASVADQTYTMGLALNLDPDTFPIATSNNALTYALTGLPSSTELSFDGNTRVLSGIPTIPGTYNMTYTARDQTNGLIATLPSFTITINAALTFSETVPPQNYNEKQAISFTLPAVNGGTPPWTTDSLLMGSRVFQTISCSIKIGRSSPAPPPLPQSQPPPTTWSTA